jgi:poly(A) polymerase
LLEQPRFRSAFDLLMLRAQLGLAPAEIAAWWTRLQEAAPEQRLAMLDTLAKPHGPKPSASQAASAAEDDNPAEPGTAAPQRAAHRRRRRRRFRGPA